MQHLPRLAICTEGNSQIGMGHIFRTLALAEFLREWFQILFVLIRSSEAARQSIYNQGFDSKLMPPRADKRNAVAALNKALDGIAAVVTDSYGFDTDFQEAIRQNRKLACIDDIHAFPFACDLILNHSPHAKTSHYQTLGQPPRFCLGLNYALLRKEFFDKDMQHGHSPNAILICMGGTDHSRAGLRILQALGAWKPSCLQVVYVTTSANASIDDVRALCDITINTSIKIDLQAAEMRYLLSNACLLISTPSTIALEGIACRVPLMTLTTADNQIKLAHALHEQGAALSLGEAQTFSETQFQVELETFFQMGSFYQTMKMRQSKLIDLQSNSRIVKEFKNLFCEIPL